jgi:hypothetical protein
VATISTGRDVVKTAMRAGQEKMEAAINSTSEFEETNNTRVEDVLTPVDLEEALNTKISETRLDLETVMTSVDTRLQNLREEFIS